MDEVSKAIGQLQGEMKGIVSSVEKVFEKLDTMHTEQTNQKIDTTRLTVKVTLITAILTYGVAKGLEIYAKTHWGN